MGEYRETKCIVKHSLVTHSPGGSAYLHGPRYPSTSIIFAWKETGRWPGPWCIWFLSSYNITKKGFYVFSHGETKKTFKPSCSGTSCHRSERGSGMQNFRNSSKSVMSEGNGSSAGGTSGIGTSTRQPIDFSWYICISSIYMCVPSMYIHTYMYSCI